MDEKQFWKKVRIRVRRLKRKKKFIDKIDEDVKDVTKDNFDEFIKKQVEELDYNKYRGMKKNA